MCVIYLNLNHFPEYYMDLRPYLGNVGICHITISIIINLCSIFG